MLKFEPPITPNRQFHRGMNHFRVTFKASMPATDETFVIGVKVKPAAQFANLQLRFAKRGHTALVLLSGFSGHNSYPCRLTILFSIKRIKIKKGSRNMKGRMFSPEFRKIDYFPPANNSLFLSPYSSL